MNPLWTSCPRAGLATHCRAEGGSSVLLVLLLMTLFVGVGFAFRQTMSLEGRAITLHAESLQAGEAARAGLEVALALLRADETSFDSLSDPWRVSALLEGELGPGVRYSLRPEQELQDNGIVDLESQLAVNVVPEAALLRLPGLSAKAVLDVLEARQRAPLESVEQFLRLSQLDERTFERAAGAPAARVLSTLALEGRVNVNTAGAFVLGVALGDEDLVQRLLARRRGLDGLDGTADDQPWRSLEELDGQLDSAAGSRSTNWSVQSLHFRVVSTGEVRSGTVFVRRRLRALVERSAGGEVRVVSCSEL